MSEKKRILITGGAGFIGSHLAEDLVKSGYSVKIIDDFSTGNVNNILGLFNYKNFKMIRGSITDKELLTKAVSNVDAIFHLAAQIHVDRSIIEPSYTFKVNTLGTLNILDAALENDVEPVVYASTSEVYGSAKYVPMDEDHPLNPASPYAASKAAADRLCFSYYNTYKLPVVIVRCFNTYGPRQKDSGYAAAIPKFIKRALAGLPAVIYGDGKQTRDYMYVRDTVSAYKLILKSYENVLGKAINFGTGKEISILELAKTISQLAGNKSTPIHAAPRAGEVTRLCADMKLAEKTLGFTPEYSIKKGLEEFINWYRAGRYEEWIAYTSSEEK
ncbi:NAD-dependent epimerase/dehydratase family protein [Candidatus Bathyarchaeota archaeon]|nr:NAD-dependent epimerase/dehydratase family protein [Candidatus Bathyarchaeota archaeon]